MHAQSVLPKFFIDVVVVFIWFEIWHSRSFSVLVVTIALSVALGSR